MGSAKFAGLSRVKGNRMSIKKARISLTAKAFYDPAWVNVIVLDKHKLVMPFLYRTKKEALKDYPSLVKKENRKTVKVSLVEF